ncbi:hypothetical protein Hanom_Chr11g01045331 [Helianthus anomalus]
MTVYLMLSPATYFASVNANEEDFMMSPIASFVATIFFRMARNWTVRASLFFFRRAWPLVAPTRRALMTPRTVTVGTTFKRWPWPDILLLICYSVKEKQPKGKSHYN